MLKYENVKIKGLRVFANHGVYDEEKRNGQEFIVDITLYTDLSRPGYSDELKDTINYALVCEKASSFLRNNTFDLIEKVAYELSKELLLSFDKLNKVDITLHKPQAPIGIPFEDISVNIENHWSDVCLSVGSNIGSRQDYIDKTLCKLEEIKSIKDIKVSSIIETQPYGYVNQDKFLNGAISLKTCLNPYELLHEINRIEAECGRERLIHWGPRTLDLDILLYDDEIMNEPELIIPHADMHNREFVLKPLSEIEPLRVHPVLKKTITEMLEDLK